MRAVTFQSMWRTSSPGWYSRTSSNSMPRPLKALSYSPASRSVTTRWVRIWIALIFWKSSGGSAWLMSVMLGAYGRSGDIDGVEDLLDDVVAGEVLGLGLVGDEEAVTEDVRADGLHVLGRHVGAPFQEGVHLGGAG